MDLNQRRVWNDNHKVLTDLIVKPEEHKQTVQLFLSQHALLHSSKIVDTGTRSLEDEVLKGLDESTFRQYPVTAPDTKNSIAWHIWHIARIEDITINLLVADCQQVLFEGNWFEKMNCRFLDSGNDMSKEEIAELSTRIHFESLLAYREAVGRQTRYVVSQLEPGQFKMKVEQNRVQRLFEEEAVSQRSYWLAEYWSKKKIAGFILMPATRHNFLHLNKCVRIKDRLNKKVKTPRFCEEMHL